MKKIFAVALLSSLSVPALAESSYYGALDVGQTTVQNACKNLAAVYSCNNSATAIRIAVGYQLTPRFGVEASYGDYGSLKSSTSQPTYTWNGETRMSGLEIVATGNYPISDSFSLLGKLGIARSSGKHSAVGTGLLAAATFSSSFTSTTAAYGIGAQYSLTNSVALRVQYDDLGVVGDSENGKSRINLLSAGVVYKF